MYVLGVQNKRKLLDTHHENMIRARADQYGRYEILDVR